MNTLNKKYYLYSLAYLLIHSGFVIVLYAVFFNYDGADISKLLGGVIAGAGFILSSELEEDYIYEPKYPSNSPSVIGITEDSLKKALSAKKDIDFGSVKDDWSPVISAIWIGFSIYVLLSLGGTSVLIGSFTFSIIYFTFVDSFLSVFTQKNPPHASQFKQIHHNIQEKFKRVRPTLDVGHRFGAFHNWFGQNVVVINKKYEDMSIFQIEFNLAHEFAHLENSHPVIFSFISGAFLYIPLLLAISLGSFSSFSVDKIAIGSSVLSLLVTIYTSYYQRQSELYADKRAAEIVSKPEAIKSLLHDSNTNPFIKPDNSTRKFLRFFKSHPDTSSRINHIANLNDR